MNIYSRLSTIVVALAASLPITPAAAGRNFDRALASEKAWEVCVVQAAQRMAGRAEAETVVEAAFGRCSAEEEKFRGHLQEWSRPLGIGAGYDAEEMRQQMEVQRKRIRSLAFAAVLDTLPPPDAK